MAEKKAAKKPRPKKKDEEEVSKAEGKRRDAATAAGTDIDENRLFIKQTGTVV